MSCGTTIHTTSADVEGAVEADRAAPAGRHATAKTAPGQGFRRTIA